MDNSEALKINFWPYDVFGYFLPGVIFVYVFCATNSNLFTIVSNELFLKDDQLSYVLLALWAMLSYVIGHVIAALSSYLLERTFVRCVFRYPTKWLLFHDKKYDSQGACKGSKWFWINYGYDRHYTDQFRKLFAKQYKKTFKTSVIDESECYAMCWQWITLNHPLAYGRATHFLELYGFNRNVAMCLILFMFFPFVPGWVFPISIFFWYLALFFVFLILFSNFLKLIRRMNDEVYRGFVVSSLK